jgi:hypothetical protein
MLKKLIFSLLILSIQINNLSANDIDEQFESQYALGFQDISQYYLGLTQINTLNKEILKQEISNDIENFKNKKYATFCRQYIQLEDLKAILIHTSINTPKPYARATLIQQIDDEGIASIFNAQGRFYIIHEHNAHLPYLTFNTYHGFSVTGVSFPDAFANLKYYLNFETKEAFIDYVNVDLDFKDIELDKFLIEQFINWLKNINCINKIGLRTSEHKLEFILNELNFSHSMSYERICGFDSNYSLILR